MERITVRSMVLAGLATIVLAGCSSTEPEETVDVMQDVAPAAEAQEVTPPEPTIQKPRVTQTGKIVIDQGALGMEELQGVFYFDFDQAIVKRVGHSELNKHAMVLTGDRSIRVRLEGHADERGTREYNLALGERRANAVKAYLQAQGVMSSQMEVVSFGEEQPASDGHTEQAWAQNRRVEVVYKR